MASIFWSDTTGNPITAPRASLSMTPAWCQMGAEETLRRIIEARSQHPVCDIHDDDDPITCGWKRVVLDIDDALSPTNRAELVEESDRGNRMQQAKEHRSLYRAALEAPEAE